jgi:hypothetical protein
MWGIKVNLWLLMVGSQTASLTPGLSFDHNLCFKCPNGSCEPILNIYVSINFQWCKQFFELMGFDPSNRALKIWESIWESNSHNGSSLGSVKVHSLTLFAPFALPRTYMWCDFRASLLTCNLASPCIGREPKAKVATLKIKRENDVFIIFWNV